MKEIEKKTKVYVSEDGREFLDRDECEKYDRQQEKIKYFEERLLFLNKELGTDYQSLGMVDWSYVSSHYKLSEIFIREFKGDVSWYWISRCQKLSEDFIREFSDRVNWDDISSCQKLSENFIREFKDSVDWDDISIYQKLSENFIREFKDEVKWVYISEYQKLSDDFIREFKKMVDWSGISRCQKLSYDFTREFKDKLNFDAIKENWAYTPTRFLKGQVKATGLYECHDDYFIAYKGIRSDRYSKYNFQYQYLPGEAYESFCDCSPNKASFGLSVWTKEKAKEYCNELVVKVKVRYEDVGRVVHDGGKIRCRKITILN